MRAAIEIILLLIGAVALGQAEVVIDHPLPEIAISDPAQRSKVLNVPFTVAGMTVSGMKASSSCGCVKSVLEKDGFVVGEHGVLTVVVDLTGCQGFFRRTVTLAWDEAGLAHQTAIDITFRLPEVYTLSQAMPRWDVGQPASQVLTVRFKDPDAAVLSVEEEAPGTAFASSLRQEGPGVFAIDLRPLDLQVRTYKYLHLHVRCATARITRISVPCLVTGEIAAGRKP